MFERDTGIKLRDAVGENAMEFSAVLNMCFEIFKIKPTEAMKALKESFKVRLGK